MSTLKVGVATEAYLLGVDGDQSFLTPGLGDCFDAPDALLDVLARNLGLNS